MELAPWRPFGELSSFRREMDWLWDTFFNDKPLGKMFREDWFPSVDISETKDKLLIKAELPGLEAQDVDVNISEDVLNIRGEKKKEEEQKDEHYYSCERYRGSFHRSFRLPVNVRTDKIEATFDRGILKLTLPKTEEAKKKNIKIKVK